MIVIKIMCLEAIFFSYKYRETLKKDRLALKVKVGIRCMIFANFCQRSVVAPGDMLNHTPIIFSFSTRAFIERRQIFTRVTCACNFTYFMWRIVILFDAFFEKALNRIIILHIKYALKSESKSLIGIYII